MGKWFMQAPFLVYPSIKFFIQAIKKKFVSPSLFWFIIIVVYSSH
jgi:hypothetical protein